jgi:hypothetical protein
MSSNKPGTTNGTHDEGHTRFINSEFTLPHCYIQSVIESMLRYMVEAQDSGHIFKGASS